MPFWFGGVLFAGCQLFFSLDHRMGVGAPAGDDRIPLGTQWTPLSSSVQPAVSRAEQFSWPFPSQRCLHLMECKPWGTLLLAMVSSSQPLCSCAHGHSSRAPPSLVPPPGSLSSSLRKEHWGHALRNAVFSHSPVFPMSYLNQAIYADSVHSEPSESGPLSPPSSHTQHLMSVLAWPDTHACVCMCVRACCPFSCVWLCNPVDCSLPGSSVHGILQARVLEWVAMPSSRWSSQPRAGTHDFFISCIGSQVLYQECHLGSFHVYTHTQRGIITLTVCFTLVSMGHWREGISEESLNHRKGPLKLSESLAWSSSFRVWM